MDKIYLSKPLNNFKIKFSIEILYNNNNNIFLQLIMIWIQNHMNSITEFKTIEPHKEKLWDLIQKKMKNLWVFLIYIKKPNKKKKNDNEIIIKLIFILHMKKSTIYLHIQISLKNRIIIPINYNRLIIC